MKEIETKFTPLTENVYMEVTTYSSIDETMDNFYVKFSNSVKTKELLEKLFNLSKLYFRVFYKKAPKEMVKQSSITIDEILSSFEDLEERFYVEFNELRKIEIYDTKTKKYLLIIKRKQVYIPKSYSLNYRELFVSSVLEKT